MAQQIVPLTQVPNQTFTLQLSVDGNPLTLGLQVSYSAMAGWWQMQVSDVQGNVLIASVPLVTGQYPAANMLAQYGYLEIGSAYVLNASSTPQDYPTENALTKFLLLWGDTA